MRKNHPGIRSAPSGLPDKLAPRHALLNVLHRSAARRLVVMSAPAGSGKTLSTLLWIRDAERLPVWLRAREDNASLAGFYRELCGGLLSAQPDNAAMRAILESPDFGSAPVEAAMRLIAAMRPPDDLHALVLDDMHRITSQEIWKSLPLVLPALPMEFSAFILSRSAPPPEAFADWEEKKRLARVGGAELAFTRDEIALYFREHGRDLSEPELAAAMAMTGGWAMGVNALAMTGSISLGVGNSLDAYLRDNVWEEWDGESRDFLLRIAVVEEVEPELAVRLSGRADAGEMLERLREANSFVVRQGDVYRVHHLFLDFLRKKLAESPEMDAPALYRAAGRFYRERNRLYEALRMAILGNDAEGIAAGMFELYRYSNQGNAVAQHAERLGSFLGGLVPDAELENNPFLLINFIWYHYLMGDAETQYKYHDRFYSIFPSLVAEHEDFAVLGLLITTLDGRYPPAAKTLELGRDLRLKNPDAKAQTITCTENHPYYNRSNRDYSYCSLDIEEGLAEFHQAWGAILGDDDPIIEHGIRASIHYERNELRRAWEEAERSRSHLKPDSIGEIHFATGVVGMLTARAMGKDALYQELTEEAREYVAERAPYLMPNFAAVEMKFILMDADKEAARDWLSRYYVTEPERPEFYKLYQHFTTARAYMVLGRIDAARALLGKLKRLGEEYRRPLDVAEANVLLAALGWAAGVRDKALTLLRDTLEAMQPYCFTRIFANEGAAVLSMLRKIQAETNRPRYAGDLKREYVHTACQLAYEESKRHRGVAWNIRAKPIKLSRQQKMILDLVAQGRKQAEISEQTGLALPTIKAHLYVTYKKLDVNNARDAILKARELGLMG